MKSCSKCNLVKPASEFPPHRGRRDGLQSYCRACQYTRVQEIGQANRAEAAAVHQLKELYREDYERLLADARSHA